MCVDKRKIYVYNIKKYKKCKCPFLIRHTPLLLGPVNVTGPVFPNTVSTEH